LIRFSNQPRMELRHLRSFIAVAEELHFRKAAERLGMSQPPLSQQIRALEAEVRVRLLYRTRQEVRLTPEGAVLLERARDILQRVWDAGEAARGARHGKTGKLDIAYTPALEIRVLPRVLRRFRRLYPNIEVRVTVQTSAEQAENLKRRRLDAGFVVLPTRDRNLNVRRIGSERLILIAPTDHPLGKCPGTPLKKLEGERFVLLSRPFAPNYHDLVISATRAAGVSLHVVAEAKNFHESLSLVASGLGVSVVPSAVRDIPWKGVSYCPVEASAPKLELAVASRKDEPSGLTRKFLGVVRELYGAA
jgi:DNA-binding transcriptional LysR family regulator